MGKNYRYSQETDTKKRGNEGKNTEAESGRKRGLAPADHKEQRLPNLNFLPSSGYFFLNAGKSEKLLY